MSTRAAKEDREKGRVQAIDRAFLLLREMLAAPLGLTALQLAGRTGLDRTTVHRLLRTLAHWGLTEAHGARHRLGPESLVLASAYLDRLNVRRAALPHAIDLQEKGIGSRPGIVSIAVPAHEEVVIIERLWSPSAPLSILFEIGTRLPIDGSPSGRAILSTYPAERGIALVGAKRYEAIRPRLKEVAAQGGLSFGLSELHPGVGTLACALRGPGGEALGALVMAGLGFEKDLRADSRLAHHLLRAAKNVSSQLAHT
ncbi:MAG TPA: helix-turn-helix domain-containing protein [Burkholderiales bacterium]|nr:helix-turn-helix domain-containing protein [Burkholderiales bacterium]